MHSDLMNLSVVPVKSWMMQSVAQESEKIAENNTKSGFLTLKDMLKSMNLKHDTVKDQNGNYKTSTFDSTDKKKLSMSRSKSDTQRGKKRNREKSPRRRSRSQTKKHRYILISRITVIDWVFLVVDIVLYLRKKNILVTVAAIEISLNLIATMLFERRRLIIQRSLNRLIKINQRWSEWKSLMIQNRASCQFAVT